MAPRPLPTSSVDNVIFSNNSGGKIDGRGASGNDSYFGGNGKDELWAGSGKDYLDGGILHGGSNQTTMVGGNGGDVLYGGTGTDTFLYRAASESPYAAGGPASDADSAAESAMASPAGHAGRDVAPGLIRMPRADDRLRLQQRPESR